MTDTIVFTTKSKKSRAVTNIDVYDRVLKKTPINIPSASIEIVEWSSDTEDAWMIDDALALHYESFKKLKDKLPKHFIEDVVRRGTGNFYIARVSVEEFHKYAPAEENVETCHSHVVLGACLLIQMVFWSTFKDTEFMLRKISNIFSLFVDGRVRGAGIGGRLLDRAAGTLHVHHPVTEPASRSECFAHPCGVILNLSLLSHLLSFISCSTSCRGGCGRNVAGSSLDKSCTELI